MPTSAIAASQAASFLPTPSPRRRFTILSNDGYLAACGGIGGPPVTVVPHPRDAVHFVDHDTAINRARLMTEVGWTGLEVVEIQLPRR